MTITIFNDRGDIIKFSKTASKVSIWSQDRENVCLMT